MTQEEYISILFNDCGFTGAQRRDFLALRYGGRRYADELTPSERHALIEDLKARKVVPVPAEDDEDEDADLTARQRFRRQVRAPRSEDGRREA